MARVAHVSWDGSFLHHRRSQQKQEAERARFLRWLFQSLDQAAPEAIHSLFFTLAIWSFCDLLSGGPLK